MRAGLERDIDRGAARRGAGFGERDRLGVRAAARRRPAPADDDRLRPIGADDDRADRRVGIGAAEVAPAETERRRHEPAVELAIDLLRRTGVHGAHASLAPTGFSPDSSPTNASKSLASRKFL